MKIHLRDYPAYKKNLIGNFYGYSIAYNRIIERLEALGVENDPEAPIEFSFCAPSIYRKTPGKTSVLFSMFESKDIYAEAVPRIREADVLVVPAPFCRDIFAQFTTKPILIIPLGGEMLPVRDDLPSHSISPEHPFRFLYLGAFNPRKGWVALATAWQKYFAQDPELELYVKTTHQDVQKQRIFDIGNAKVDGRNVSREELVSIYHSAHCFVLPTLGEGWGQSILEAMSAGIPVITTEWSGHLQFANRGNCTFVPHSLHRSGGDEGVVSSAIDGKFEWAMVRPSDLAQTMMEVMADYQGALRKAERAEREIRRYTWDACASGLVTLFQRLYRNEKP